MSKFHRSSDPYQKKYSQAKHERAFNVAIAFFVPASFIDSYSRTNMSKNLSGPKVSYYVAKPRSSVFFYFCKTSFSVVKSSLDYHYQSSDLITARQHETLNIHITLAELDISAIQRYYVGLIIFIDNSCKCT